MPLHTVTSCCTTASCI